MQIDPTMLAALLATASPREPVTLTATAPAAVWRRMLAATTPAAPEVLSTRECAARFGWTDADWRRWAPDISGSLRVGKKWRIPSEAAKAKADALMKRSGAGEAESTGTDGPRRGGNHGKFRSKAAPAPAEGDGAQVVPIAGRIRRG